MEKRNSLIIFSILKVALSAQAICLFAIIAALCVTQFQGDYLVYYFEASKKWSNIVNLIPNLIKKYRIQLQVWSAEKRNFTESEILLPVPR